MTDPATAGPRLTVAISTLGERAGDIALPPPDPDICWLVLVQRPDAAPELPVRADLTVVPLETRGVAASRNAALDRAETPFLLFGDDDIAFDMGGVKRLLAVLEADPALAIVTGRRGGSAPARYAGQGHPLRLWNAAKTGTPEILLRLAPVRAAGVRFDAKFGLGGKYPLGDEYVFLADALKAGLKGRFEPIVLFTHEGDSTGADWADADRLRARIAVLNRVFGRAAPLMRLAFAVKNRRRLKGAPGGVRGFVRGRIP